MESMVALQTAKSVVQGLGQLTCLAEHIAEEWYEVSQELQEFKELQSDLKSKVIAWKEAVRSEGMSDDVRLQVPLDHAIKCLEDEKIRVDTAVSHCCLFRLVSFFRPHPFPPTVKDSMKRVMDAFDHIHDRYREAAEPARIVEQMADTRVDDLNPITVDPRWVTLTETHDKVVNLLGEKSGNKVVTLYGGSGSGKTTLATQVAAYYQENKTTFTDGVRFFPCGRDATVDSVCKELFQSLGFDAPEQGSSKAEQALKSKGGSAPTEKPALVKLLARRLRERSFLIILDGVANSDLLEKLIVHDAKDVKYLITSQWPRVYDGAALVHMQLPSEQEAKQILVNFIPNSPKSEIPVALQGKANEIIEKADKLPGILARIGAQIDDFDNGSWDVALKECNLHLLSSEQTNKLDVSMLMAVDALGENSNAKKLLYLLAMCQLEYVRDEYVPEEVLELLYQRIECIHHSKFKLYKKNLKDRDLILVAEKKGWKLTNRYQMLILKNRKEEVSEVLLTLLKENNDDDNDELVKALCTLYVFFNKDNFTSTATIAIQEIAKKFGISLEDQEKKFDMRGAIWKLMHLLWSSKEATEGGQCQMRRHRLASKVIKQFISKQELDDGSFVQLLGEKDIFEDMCEDLRSMASVTYYYKERPLLTKETLNLTLEELIFKLDLTSEEIVTTMDTLSALSEGENCDLILDNDRVLTKLLEILHSIDQDEVQAGLINSTLNCLSALAKSLTAREKIASYEGLLEALVMIICKDCDLTESKKLMLKVDAIDALGSIALHRKTSNSLVQTPNLLSSMAQFLEDAYFKAQGKKCFSETGHLGAAYSATSCLLSLLKGNDANKGNIRKHEHLMHVLTKIFETDNRKNICLNNLEGYFFDDEDVAARIIPILTMIDPAKYNKVKLHSSGAYINRGEANIFCGLYKEAFEDYKNADYLDKFNDGYYKTTLCFLKAKLKDYEGALYYGKCALDGKPNSPFFWQEVGVTKELMEDYKGAKVDLTKALEFGPNDYECLKHRAYVNFKLGCEEEAREDAEKALQVLSKRPIMHDSEGYDVLGYLPVSKFLEYELK